jgi:hypothetical protein
LLAMIVSKRRSSSWHPIRTPFLGCVLVVASCPTHIASEAAPALLGRSVQYQLTNTGQTYGVDVAVTSAGARNVKLDIKVDDQPKP